MKTITFALVALALLAGPALADASGDHPAYLHALEDLRHARAHLERPAGMNPKTRWDERVAVGKIDAAMTEIRRAALDDGKDLKAHPPVDAKLDWPGRLRRSLELLRKAREDINQDEDNKFARGLKARALGHIDQAVRFVEEGIANEAADAGGKHPAYLHALEDLRHARAHLERPTGSPQTNWDEKVAIRKIDEAIGEIKAAAIEDGKDLSNHPPVDAKLDWHGRLQRALELLLKARADVDREEDNDFARGLKARAVDHISQAARLVEQGIAAR